MANYGLDADLKAKQDAKYDHELEKQVVEWVSAVSGRAKEADQSVAAWLQDGQVLCATVNAIVPGKITKVSTMMAPFKKMENIKHFTDAARSMGVPEASMFATPDLYEEKNMGSVINCIYTFAGVVQTVAPGFNGPKLGNPIKAELKDVRQAKGPATQMGGLSANLSPRPMGGGARERAAQPSSPSGAAGPPAAQGLDADMKARMAEKMDVGLEAEVIAWIEAVTGQKKGDQSSAEWLKNGHVFCALAKAIKPSVAPSPGKGNMPFVQMENLSKFLTFMRNCGMNESSMFSTPDLFEEKNMAIVFTSIYTFGGVVQANVPEFHGPHLGNAVNTHVKDTKRNLGLVTDQTEAMQRTMEQERPRDGGITRGA